MDESVMFFLSAIAVIMGFCAWGYANNVADNQAILDLVSKGVPVLEAKCAIRSNAACDIFLGMKAMPK